MTDQQPIPDQPAYKDKSTGLVIFGLIQVLIGLVLAGVLALSFIGIVVTASGSPDSSQLPIQTMIPALLIYGVAALWFGWLGIGSIKCRRWARALSLVFSWLWLVIGGFVSISMFVFLSSLSGFWEQMLGASEDMIALFSAIAVAFCIVFLVTLPGVFVLFYGSSNVETTCRFRDKNQRWTDRLPLPVLALVLIDAYAAINMLVLLPPAYPFPLFGFTAGGLAGLLLKLALFALFVWLGWSAKSLRMSVWKGHLTLLVVGSLSIAMTLYRLGMIGMYETMSYPPETIEMMRAMFEPVAWLSGITQAVWFLAMLGFLLYIKKHFVPKTTYPNTPTENTLPA